MDRDDHRSPVSLPAFDRTLAARRQLPPGVGAGWIALRDGFGRRPRGLGRPGESPWAADGAAERPTAVAARRG